MDRANSTSYRHHATIHGTEECSYRCTYQSSFGKTTCATLLAFANECALHSSFGNIKGKLYLKGVIITSHFLDFVHLIEYPAAMSLPSGLYTLEASPPTPIGVGGLYATGNGINEIVTVVPNTPPVVDRQIVSTRHLHVFSMIKTANALLPILFSGRS